MTEGAPRYWWLSFVDRAADGEESVAMHLGCAIVMATSFDEAVHEAWTRKINPGGEVGGMPLKPRIFRSIPDRRRFTYRLLEGADIGEAQLAIEKEERAIPAETDEGVCWHDGRRCSARHDRARHILFGRCRSGRRWFWFAVRCVAARGAAPHCDSPVCHYGGPHEHGKADTEEAALTAARAAVERLADCRPAIGQVSQGGWPLSRLGTHRRRALASRLVRREGPRRLDLHG
jgi:hypothetical protein